MKKMIKLGTESGRDVAQKARIYTFLWEEERNQVMGAEPKPIRAIIRFSMKERPSHERKIYQMCS